MPPEERFGLTAQIRQASVSIASNIAEGHNRRSDGVLVNHLRIALGSQAELETQIELSARLGFLHQSDVGRLREQAAAVGRLLSGLLRSVQSSRGCRANAD
jgi:four helix bundle protein